MGIHEWSYDNAITPEKRHKVPLKDKVVALANIKVEVELVLRSQVALRRDRSCCLNCDVQTVFNEKLCASELADARASTFCRWTASRSRRTAREAERGRRAHGAGR
jgi:hypothetical protein